MWFGYWMENCTWNVHYKHTNTHNCSRFKPHYISILLEFVLPIPLLLYCCCWRYYSRTHTLICNENNARREQKKPHINLQPHVISRNATNSFSCVLIFISLGRRKKACHFYTEWLYKFTATPDGETMDRERLELLTSPMAQKTIFMYKRRYYATPSNE